MASNVPLLKTDLAPMSFLTMNDADCIDGLIGGAAQSIIWRPVTPHVILVRAIRSWRHKGLRDLLETGRSSRVRQDQRERILRRLDALNVADAVTDVDIPGFGLHKLKGNPPRWAIAVNGPWRITFEWRDGDAYEADLEQYH